MDAPPTDLTSTPKAWFLKDLTGMSSAASWSIAVEQTGVDTAYGTYWLGIGDDCSMVVFGRAEGDALCTSGDCATGAATCDGTDKYGTCSGTEWAGLASYPPACTYASMDGEQSASGSYPHTAALGTVETMTIWGRGKAPHPIHIHVNRNPTRGLEPILD